jgi:HD-GYP domain-containing protein (c-di-GMP phosphodiesterase class II)
LNEEEFENIKKHSIYGYRILEKQKNLDPRIKMVALLHHERCDGKGYPQRRKYDDIDYFTKLVAIADVYEAMTSSRKYRNKICPFEVVEMFEREGFQKFDPDLVISLLERIAQTQLNNVVKLSSGETGEIVFINRLSLARPILKVNDALIDLTDWPDLKIIEVL